MKRPLVVIQARVGSTRLPGKVLLPLAGEPLLARMVERVRAARTPLDVVVATTTDARDDAVVDLCARRRIAVMRGHPTDVLLRHYQAASAAGAEVVVKIPSDCPLIDPRVIDRVMDAFAAEPCDYASNLHPASWPDGNDVEAMTFAALARAHAEAKEAHEREHTTPYLWEAPGRFRAVNVAWETGLDLSRSHRFTIDYPEDYRFTAAVYDALYTRARPVFALEEILALTEKRPEILALNARFAGETWYTRRKEQLRRDQPQEAAAAPPTETHR